MWMRESAVVHDPPMILLLLRGRNHQAATTVAGVAASITSSQSSQLKTSTLEDKITFSTINYFPATTTRII